MQENIYQFNMLNNKGEQISFEQFREKVVLITNVASFCGLTNHYLGLENLFQKYQNKGFSILAFPCNQFGAQEPGSDDEIAQFCQTNYQISFPLFRKVEVNGENAIELFKFLKNNASENQGQDIEWNFAKFLINRQGEVFRRYHPTTLPENLETDIEHLL